MAGAKIKDKKAYTDLLADDFAAVEYPSQSGTESRPFCVGFAYHRRNCKGKLSFQYCAT
jgi:hypothetical protein